MPYPPLLILDETAQSRLLSYVRTEILNHNAERGDYINKLQEYQRLYWADPDTDAIANAPLTGGSSIVIPIAAIAIEAFHARNMTTLFSLDDFTMLKLPAKYQDLEFGLEKLLDHEFVAVGNLYKCADNVLLDGTKLGTGIAKSGWVDYKRKAIRYNADGEREEFEVSTQRGVTFEPVQVSNFLLPYAYTNPQTCPWVGEEHRSSLYEIKCMEDNGIFYKGVYEKVLNAYTPQAALTPGAQALQNQQSLEDKSPIIPKVVQWYEIWMTFNTDNTPGANYNNDYGGTTGTGNDKEIVLFYESLTDTLMGIRYNWHDDLHRPYRYYNHFPIEHRWTGVGMCKMLEQFQIEITTQHRQTIDAATLANLRMFKIKKLSGFSPSEPVFAGKLWFVDEMEDVEPLQLGEVYPSAYNSEASALNYSQQRSSINEISLGMQSQGTPGTAADILSRIQEGKHRFDYTYKNIRLFISQLQHDGLCNMVQFGVRNALIYENIPSGQLVRSFIETNPISLFRDSIIISVNVAGQNQNKLLDRASWTQLAGMLVQYWTQMMTLAQQNPMLQQLLPQFSVEAIASGTKAMQQILESFDIRNPDKLLIDRATITGLIAKIMPQADPNQIINGLTNGTQTPNPGLLLGSGAPQQSQGLVLPNTLPVQVGGSVA